MIKRLRKRFIRIAMLSVTVVMLILSLIVNIANFVSTDSDLKEMLDTICENKGTIPTRDEPDTDNADSPDDKAPKRKPDNRGAPFNQEAPYSTRYFNLRFDGSGNLSFADLDHIASITNDDIDEYISVALKHGAGYGYYSDYKYRVIKHGEDRYMAVFLDCYQELRAVKIVAVCSFAAMVVCIVLVCIPVVFFSGKAIEPVAESAKRQKQFITDAGHELKTPITVIATSLKVLEMETGKQKWIDKAMSQTERLKELVNSLVTLSRMDEEESPLKFKQFSISDTVSETAESFVDFARSMGHELNITIAPNISYYGDEYAIRQLVSVLLDNAIKYAVDGAPVYFSLEKAKRDILIRTSNECEKIDSDDLEKLFDRFYRADKSRNVGTGGFGIGLSVARSIAEGHGGSIQAKCPAENIIEFSVKLK
ncbi:MAG: sensor histidine kinase [Oscillospiraceae bacterium]